MAGSEWCMGKTRKSYVISQYVAGYHRSRFVGSPRASTFSPWVPRNFGMSDRYTSFGVSPRKKRCVSPGADEAIALTPKRIRTRCPSQSKDTSGVKILIELSFHRGPPSPPSTIKREPAKEQQTTSLPANLSRLLNTQTTL